mmetsp:Transcript_67487/g.161081  ORF Transcript_67487/g.161081 Transcript_67487/m.161081 type:complete len:209 (-) Transcript_67487:179-805(-)
MPICVPAAIWEAISEARASARSERGTGALLLPTPIDDRWTCSGRNERGGASARMRGGGGTRQVRVAWRRVPRRRAPHSASATSEREHPVTNPAESTAATPAAYSRQPAPVHLPICFPEGAPSLFPLASLRHHCSCADVADMAGAAPRRGWGWEISGAVWSELDAGLLFDTPDFPAWAAICPAEPPRWAAPPRRRVFAGMGSERGVMIP